MKSGNDVPPLSRQGTFRSARRRSGASLYGIAATAQNVRLLLECALTDLDRADRLREAIDCEGVTITSARDKLPRAHPALKVESEMRRRFLAAWRALDLTWR